MNLVGRGWCFLGYGSYYNTVDDDTVMIRDGHIAEADDESANTDFSVNERLDYTRGGHWQPAETWIEDSHTIVVWRKQQKQHLQD